MRKLFWQMNVTLDGMMEGPKGELDDTAQVVDKALDQYAGDMLNSIDGMLLGRKTYQLFAGYWPTAKDPEAERMNTLPKFVFSKTLDKAEWKNARLVKGDVADEVMRLKQQPGNDLALFGSADLAATLLRLSLIDEIRMFVNPIALGAGHPMFKERTKLKLLNASTVGPNIVAMYYQPIKK